MEAGHLVEAQGTANKAGNTGECNLQRLPPAPTSCSKAPHPKGSPVSLDSVTPRRVIKHEPVRDHNDTCD